MKRNDLLEAKKLDEKALTEKALALRASINELIMDKNMNKLKDLRSISKARLDLAQYLTILRQKQLIRELEKGERGA